MCDVVKHSVLTLVLEQLLQKTTPLCVLDTHAGMGLYDLDDPRALKTGEADSGIHRFLSAPPMPALKGYCNAIEELNSGGSSRLYPGSPLLMAKLVRPHDRIVACELHPEDVDVLRRHARSFSNLHVHHRDGYEALRAFLPPDEKRGLILVDPPFESPDEFSRLVDEVTAAHKRWPNGVFMVWYPIKERAAIWRFHEAMTATGMPRQLYAEFIYHSETRHDRLNGSGLLFINPPWQLDEKLRILLPALHDILQTEHRGVAVEWLMQ